MSAAGGWWAVAATGLGPVVTEWVELAPEDAVTAERECTASPWPNFTATCFQSQQAIEKLMKGLLARNGVVPPKTHDLIVLDGMLARVCAGWTWSHTELRTLTLGAVEYRYPGQRANTQEGQAALSICKRVWPVLAALL